MSRKTLIKFTKNHNLGIIKAKHQLKIMTTLLDSIPPRYRNYLTGLVGIFSVVLVLGVGHGPVTAAGVNVTVGPDQHAEPGDLITLVFTVSNTASSPDSYKLELTKPQNWTHLGAVTSPLSLHGGASKTIFLTFIVSKTAPAGAYTATLKATSNNDASVTDQASAAISVAAIPQVDAQWISKPPRAGPDETVQGKFRISNTGNVSDTYSIAISSVRNCSVNLEQKSVSIFPGAAKTIKLSISVSTAVAPGEEYSFWLEIASRKHPKITADLRHSGMAVPPPPGEVGGSIYPRWPATTTISVNRGDFSLSFSGSSELGSIGSFSASFSLTPTSFSAPTASFQSPTWGINLAGEGVSGGFGSVCGDGPGLSLRGNYGENISTQLVFTDTVIGTSGTVNLPAFSFRAVGGWNQAEPYHFSEIHFSKSFSDIFSLNLALGSAGNSSSSGSAFSGSATMGQGGYSIGGRFLSVSPGFPKREAQQGYRLSLSGGGGGLSWRLEGNISRIYQNPGSSQQFSSEQSYVANLALPIFGTSTLDLAKELNRTISSDTPPSIHTSSLEFTSGLSGSIPILPDGSYSLSYRVKSSRDYVAHASFVDSSCAATVSFSLESVSLESNVSASQVTNSFTGSVVDSSSSFSSTVDFSGLLDGLELTLSMTPGGSSFTASYSHRIPNAGTFSVSLTPPYSFTVSHEYPFTLPWFGPSKSRVVGRAFIDKNKNGEYDSNESTVDDLLLTLTEYVEPSPAQTPAEGMIFAVPTIQPTEKLAKTGTTGKFAFWPVPANTYVLGLEEVPFGLEPNKEYPLKLELKPGKRVLLLPFASYSSITGYVYDDANQNHKFDYDEKRMAGVKVLLQGPKGVRRVATGLGGWFKARVEPGSYKITMIRDSLPERYVPTTPASFQVTVQPTQSREIQFGVYQKPKEIVFTFGPPEPKIEYSPQQPSLDQQVTFDASASEGVGDKITSYQWEFRHEGQLITAVKGKQLTYTFDKPGQWTVKLTVKDESNMTGTKTVTFQISSS